MSDFVHLHLHSEYSLLDGACRIRDVPKAAKACGHSAVAITDHGVLYGAVEFYRACVAEGIKPIIGCEVYLAEADRREKKKTSDFFNTHLILLVKNDEGYKNLVKLVSSSFTEGFYMKPRIDIEILRKHSGGLVCLSGCLAGRISQALMKDDTASAEGFANTLKEIFGEDFYLELQNHGIPEEEKVNAGLAAISEKLGIELAATNDIHYIEKKDADNQAVLLCIQTNNVITDGRPFGFTTDEFYYKSTSEMEALFGSYKNALSNTVKIAGKCNYSFEFGKTKLPGYVPDDGSSPKEYLKKLAFEGFDAAVSAGKIKFDDNHTYDEYKMRIIYELLIISKMGYDKYYLIVWDFVHYSKTHNIPVGPGRGSGAGSLVAYLIGITDVDSVKYGLLFERFLNSERVSMPDFDIDFSDVRRDEAIKYVMNKYGEDHVSQIITFGTLAARAAVRDVGRAMGMSYSETDRIAKLIPQKPGTLIKDVMETEEARMLYNENPGVRRLLDTAMALEGMPRHASKHAAGVVITDEPLVSYLPLATCSDAVVTQYDMDTVAALGLLKFDFLGLRFLTVIADSEREIRKSDADFCVDSIPLDDNATFGLLAEGKTEGVFQFEAPGMTRMLVSMKPRSLEDIMITLALYRPGPMDSIPQYLENRHMKKKPDYKIPVLSEVLDSTCGCIVYQEQVMMICRKVANFSYGRADVLIHAMKKKRISEIETERKAFVSGAKDNFYSAEDADELYDKLAAFANYAFNKSHAAAYSLISYRTAYIKAHYPAAYFSALLTSVMGNTLKTAEYISAVSKFGIKVLPPDINESRGSFSVSDGNIRYGLSAVKSLGDSVSELIYDERRDKPFASLIDFLERMIPRGINRQQTSALVSVGAFDSLGVSRSRMIAGVETLFAALSEASRKDLDGQIDIFSQVGDKTSAPQSVFDYPDLPELTAAQKLALEKEYTGIYLSGSLLDDFTVHEAALGCTPIARILTAVGDEDSADAAFRDSDRVTVAGIVTAVTKKNTRKNELMAFVTVEDRAGEIELIVFPKAFEAYAHLLIKDYPVFVQGTVSIKDDEPPKIIVRTVGLLMANDKKRMDESNVISPPYANNGAAVKDSPAVPDARTIAVKPKEEHSLGEARRIFLRVDSRTSESFRRVLAILEIFAENGTHSVIFYVKSEDKYIKTDIRIFADDYVIGELVDICGAGNVVLK